MACRHKRHLDSNRFGSAAGRQIPCFRLSAVSFFLRGTPQWVQHEHSGFKTIVIISFPCLMTPRYLKGHRQPAMALIPLGQHRQLENLRRQCAYRTGATPLTARFVDLDGDSPSLKIKSLAFTIVLRAPQTSHT